MIIHFYFQLFISAFPFSAFSTLGSIQTPNIFKIHPFVHSISVYQIILHGGILYWGQTVASILMMGVLVLKRSLLAAILISIPAFRYYRLWVFSLVMLWVKEFSRPFLVPRPRVFFPMRDYNDRTDVSERIVNTAHGLMVNDLKEIESFLTLNFVGLNTASSRLEFIDCGNTPALPI
jgi:hypothetical protein